MSLSITLDWIAFTFKELTHDSVAWLHQFASSETGTPDTARNGYAECERQTSGLLHSWHNGREEMGHHVVISGTALRNILEQEKTSQRSLLETILHAKGSITRLDLAIDAQNELVDYDHIWACLERRQYTGNAQKTARLQGSDGGNTIYIGSRTSERFLRLYDKAIQSGVSDISWARLELETKGMVARGLANLLSTTENWAGPFVHMVNGMVQVQQCVSWDRLLPQGVVPVGIPKIEKHSDTEKWIAEQVIAAVAKHFIEHPESIAVNGLIDMLVTIKAQRDRNLQSE